MQSDLEGYSGDLLDLLDQVGGDDDFGSESTAMCLPEQNVLSDISVYTRMDSHKDHETDHKYCRSPLPSDSGVSMESPVSPPLSESTHSAGSPLSGGTSPSQSGMSRSDSVSDSSNPNSPLGGGVEDLQLTDMGLDSFADTDWSLLAEYDKLIENNGGEDTTLDMDDTGG